MIVASPTTTLSYRESFLSVSVPDSLDRPYNTHVILSAGN